MGVAVGHYRRMDALQVADPRSETDAGLPDVDQLAVACLPQTVQTRGGRQNRSRQTVVK